MRSTSSVSEMRYMNMIMEAGRHAEGKAGRGVIIIHMMRGRSTLT